MADHKPRAELLPVSNPYSIVLVQNRHPAETAACCCCAIVGQNSQIRSPVKKAACVMREAVSAHLSPKQLLDEHFQVFETKI